MWVDAKSNIPGTGERLLIYWRGIVCRALYKAEYDSFLVLSTKALVNRKKEKILWSAVKEMKFK
jgi:hypothetical protein